MGQSHEQPHEQTRFEGMAHFAGTGPASGIPSTALACKYFEPGKLLRGSNSEYRARIRGK